MTVSRGKPLAGRGAAAWVARPAAAFTLVEVLVVLGLLVLLAGISWPVLESHITASELPESADRLCSALFMARSEAVLENRRYRVRFPEESQQPVIERESDPIRFPGVFEPVTAAWASEPVLLADVQVHHVVLGRPAWTKPLSRIDDAAALKKEQKELEEDDSTKRERQRLLRGLTVDDAEGEEDARPMIVFESDGSAEWATLVLSRLSPKDELEETTPQLWVVLDGRTGLARVRPQITEEQLSDPEFYVEWEKLDLPDTVDISDLSFEVGEEQMAGGESDLGFETPGGGGPADPQDPENEFAGGGKDSDPAMMGANQPQQRPRRNLNDLGPGGDQQQGSRGGGAGNPGANRPPRGQGGQAGGDSGQPGERPRRGGGGSGGQGGGPTDTGSRQDGARGQPRDRGNLTDEERKNIDEWVRQNR